MLDTKTIFKYEGFFPVKLEYVGGVVFFVLRKLHENIFSEPFFHSALQKLPPPSSAEILFYSLHDIKKETIYIPPITPSGFIYHLSRCGSSIVAQTLSEIHKIRVISEPEIIIKLVNLKKNKIITNAELEILLITLVHFWGQNNKGDSYRLIIKFSSLATSIYAYIQKIFRETPSIFIIRNPVEIMVSLINNPSFLIIEFNQLLPMSAIRINISVQELENMSIEEYIALLIRQNLLHITRNYDKNTLLIDHLEIPDVIEPRIVDHFNLISSFNDRIKIHSRIQYHGEDASKKYENDTQWKLSKVTPAMNDAAEKYVVPAMRQLKKKVNKV